MSENNKIEPLRLGMLRQAEHAFRTHEAIVSGELSGEDLENRHLWTHVAKRMSSGDHVWARADDGSFLVHLYVLYIQGSDVKMKVLEGYELDKIDLNEMEDNSEYFIQLKGPLKFCIVKRETGENVKTGIPTRLVAERELADFLKALAA